MKWQGIVGRFVVGALVTLNATPASADWQSDAYADLKHVVENAITMELSTESFPNLGEKVPLLTGLVPRTSHAIYARATGDIPAAIRADLADAVVLLIHLGSPVPDLGAAMAPPLSMAEILKPQNVDGALLGLPPGTPITRANIETFLSSSKTLRDRTDAGEPHVKAAARCLDADTTVGTEEFVVCQISLVATSLIANDPAAALHHISAVLAHHLVFLRNGPTKVQFNACWVALDKFVVEVAGGKDPADANELGAAVEFCTSATATTQQLALLSTLLNAAAPSAGQTRPRLDANILRVVQVAFDPELWTGKNSVTTALKVAKAYLPVATELVSEYRSGGPRALLTAFSTLITANKNAICRDDSKIFMKAFCETGIDFASSLANYVVSIDGDAAGRDAVRQAFRDAAEAFVESSINHGAGGIARTGAPFLCSGSWWAKLAFPMPEARYSYSTGYVNKPGAPSLRSGVAIPWLGWRHAIRYTSNFYAGWNITVLDLAAPFAELAAAPSNISNSQQAFSLFFSPEVDLQLAVPWLSKNLALNLGVIYRTKVLVADTQYVGKLSYAEAPHWFDAMAFTAGIRLLP